MLPDRDVICGYIRSLACSILKWNVGIVCTYIFSTRVAAIILIYTTTLIDNFIWAHIFYSPETFCIPVTADAYSDFGVSPPMPCMCCKTNNFFIALIPDLPRIGGLGCRESLVSVYEREREQGEGSATDCYRKQVNRLCARLAEVLKLVFEVQFTLIIHWEVTLNVCWKRLKYLFGKVSKILFGCTGIAIILILISSLNPALELLKVVPSLLWIYRQALMGKYNTISIHINRRVRRNVKQRQDFF